MPLFVADRRQGRDRHPHQRIQEARLGLTPDPRTGPAARALLIRRSVRLAMSFDFSLVTAPFRMQPGLRRIARGRSPADGERAQQPRTCARRWPCSPASRARRCARSTPSTRAGPARACRTRRREHRRALRGRRERRGVRCRAPLLGWSVDATAQPVGDGDPAIGALLAALPPRERCVALLCLAFEEDFAVLDGGPRTIRGSRSACRRAGRPKTRSGATSPRSSAGRRQRGAARGRRIARPPGHRQRALGALRLDDLRRSASAPASGTQRRGLAGRTPTPTRSPRALLQERTADLHSDRGRSAGGVHDPGRERSARRRGHGRRRRRASPRRPGEHVGRRLAYKGLADARDRLLDWLDSRRATTVAAGA